MIDRSHVLPVARQAELAGQSRASVYYLPGATPDADERLLKRIDAMHLEYPFAGTRMLRDLLLREGFKVGRRHVGTLMAKTGIETFCRRPNTSGKHPKTRCIRTCYVGSGSSAPTTSGLPTSHTSDHFGDNVGGISIDVIPTVSEPAPLALAVAGLGLIRAALRIRPQKKS